MSAFCRPGIDDVTIIYCELRRGDMTCGWPSLCFVDREIFYVTIVSCVVREGKMSRVRQCLPAIDLEFMTSQSILVEAEQERYLAFGQFCFLSTRNRWRHNHFFCVGREEKMYRAKQCLLFVDQKLMTSQSFLVEAEQEGCLAFANVCFMSTRNL